MTDKDKEAYFHLKDKYDAFGWIVMMFTHYSKISRKEKIPSRPLNQTKYDDLIPENILKTKTYKEFLENCIEYGNTAIPRSLGYPQSLAQNCILCPQQ